MLRAGRVIDSDCVGGGTDTVNGRGGAGVDNNGSRISFSFASRNRKASVRPIGKGIVSVYVIVDLRKHLGSHHGYIYLLGIEIHVVL